MKNILLTLIAGILTACGSNSSIVPVVVENVPDNIAKLDPTKDQVTLVLPDVSNYKSIAKTMSFLASDELQGRNTGSEGIEMAAQFIEARFKNAGIQPYYSTYRDTFSANGSEAFNIIGVIPGTDPILKEEVILIGAHYDHIGTAKAVGNDTIANGANDNAAGTTAVLALADHFAGAKTNKRTLVFALFSAEEKGLLGSRHLAQKMKNDAVNLYLVYNIEMIGIPMVGKDHLLYASGYERSNFAEKFNAYAGSTVVGFLPKAKEFNLFKRSDNYPFFEKFNIPAHTVSSFDFTNFEHYHGVKDEVGLMDIAFMQNVVEQMIKGLTGVSNTATKEIKMND